MLYRAEQIKPQVQCLSPISVGNVALELKQEHIVNLKGDQGF